MSEYIERIIADTKNQSPDGLTVAQANRPEGIATPRRCG